jgi:plasmid stabilization system protein ParE
VHDLQGRHPAQGARDIEQTAHYILDQSKSQTTALRWTRSIRAKLDTLKSQPLRCPVDPDSEAYGVEVRCLLFGKKRGRYRVLFTIQADVVRILTVRHAAQQRLGEEADDPDTGSLH